MTEMTVPLVSRGNGLWGSPSPAWDHLINRESSGRPTVIQSPSVVDVNTGGNEAEGLFQITPKTWDRHGGREFAPSARLATPQRQAIVAARIFTRNPTGSDWGAGRPGREDPRELAAGLIPLDDGISNGGNNMPAAPPFKELDFMTGGGRSNRSRPPTNWLIHTEEGNSSAENLARFCNGSNNVSYHYTVRDGIVCDVVDTDYASWSVLDANAYTINLCFAGSKAGWSRDEWLQRDADIRIAAWLAVQDCRKYKIPTTVIAPPYGTPRPGISDHKYVTQALHIGTHTDVGNNFPWDVFTRYINEYDGTGAPPAQPAVPAAPVTLDRAGGTPDDQLLYRWNCLGGKTIVEALAQVRDKVCGTQDAGKPGVKTL